MIIMIQHLISNQIEAEHETYKWHTKKYSLKKLS